MSTKHVRTCLGRIANGLWEVWPNFLPCIKDVKNNRREGLDWKWPCVCGPFGILVAESESSQKRCWASSDRQCH